MVLDNRHNWTTIGGFHIANHGASHGAKLVGSNVRIHLDKGSSLSLYRQVAEGVRQLILSGELCEGAQLPATRRLATALGIHRNTVIAAYRCLGEWGLARSSVGAGTFVIASAVESGAFATGAEALVQVGDSLREAGCTEQVEARPFSWRPLLRPASGLDPDPMEAFRIDRFSVPESPILLNGAVPDHRQFPMDEFATCMRDLLADAGPRLLGYGPIEGYEPLRSWILDWLRSSGVEGLDTSRVFVVSGSQQGIDLLSRLLLSPGDCVALEQPGYTGAFMVLRQAGARMVTVPVDEEGLRLDVLEEMLDAESIKFLYTMPCYQNPTGVSLSARRRRGLLQLARRHSLAIVEDHYSSPLRYWGETPRPLLADEPTGCVSHLGTFSKILFPGLRLGWMVVPEELCQPMRQLRWATDLSSGTLTQRVLERFCRGDHLERHLERLRQINARRLSSMLQALEREFPAQTHWTRPSGGMTLWVELSERIDCLELLRDAASRGVLFTPGVAFYPNGGGRNALRLSFNRESEGRIRRGIQLLGELIKERLRVRKQGKSGTGDAAPFL